MKLNEDQTKLVIDFFKRKDKNILPACSFCNNKDWLISDTLFELREYNKGAMILDKGQQIFPLIALICRSCGQTHLFNALVLGVLEPQEKESEK